MLETLKQQWKERSIRQTIYLTKGKHKFQSINFAEYERSCTRNEMPNKFKKLQVPKVEVEEVYDLSHQNTPASMLSPPVLLLKKSVMEAHNSSQKPFYYLENNEVMSVDQFFSMYKGHADRQKKLEKVIYKQTLEDRRKLVDEAHSHEVKQLARSQSALNMSSKTASQNMLDSNFNRVTPIQIDDVLEVTGDSSKDIMGRFSATRTPQCLTHKSRFMVPDMRASAPMSECTTSPGRENYRMSAQNEPQSHRGMTEKQKFTQKEVFKHLLCMSVSPKPAKFHNGNANKKEKAYSMMFKHAKMMDNTVENSIKKAQKIIITKMKNNESFNPLKVNETNVLRPSEVDDCSESQNIQNYRESYNEKMREEKLMETKTRKKIITNMKKIEKILCSNNLQSVQAKSPERLDASESDEIKFKNRLPLRSTIAQKYQFKTRLHDYKLVSKKIKDTTNIYKKDMKKSDVKSQTYASYYH